LAIVSSRIGCAISPSGACAASINRGSYVAGAITTAGTTALAVYDSTIASGAAAALTQSSAGAISLINLTVSSSNNPAIDGAGAGVITYSGLEFTDGSNLAATLTLSSAPETRTTKILAGDSTYPVNLFSIDGNVIQAYASDDTATGASALKAIEASLLVTSGDGGHSPVAIGGALDMVSGSNAALAFGTQGYCEQSDGSVIASTAAGSEGWLSLLETDIADLPAYLACGVKGYLDGSAGTAVPAGMVAGVASVMEYYGYCDSKAYGFLATRLDTPTGSAGVAALSAFGTVQGTNAIPDFLYGLDFAGSTSGFTNADVRLQNQSTIAVDTEGVTFSGDVSSRNINNTNTKMVPVTMAPVMATKANTGGVPTGATGNENLMVMQQGEIMEQHILGTQTIIAPVMDATGLLISLDLFDDDGAEFSWGILGTNRHAYTIGTSPAFFFECKIKIADAGGADPVYIGFRKIEAYAAAFPSYTDFAFIGVEESQTTEVITIADQLNTAALTYTNTTDAWTDGQTHTLRVNVSAGGVVTYLIDGVAPSVTHAFTFDATDVVMPCIHFLQGTTTPGAIHLIDMACGYQAWN